MMDDVGLLSPVKRGDLADRAEELQNRQAAARPVQLMERKTFSQNTIAV
jgi:hypothetical protein